MFQELESFKPMRTCTQTEHECKNSYGYDICVDEKVKRIACAVYTTKLCDDDKFYAEEVIRQSVVKNKTQLCAF